MDATDFHREVFVALLSHGRSPAATAFWAASARQDYDAERAAVLALYRAASFVVSRYELQREREDSP